MTYDCSKAEREAESLLKKHGIQNPPVDPEAIAESMGVSVYYADFGAEHRDVISGLIRFQELVPTVRPLPLLMNLDTS
jgi:hypothetical protein